MFQIREELTKITAVIAGSCDVDTIKEVKRKTSLRIACGKQADRIEVTGTTVRGRGRRSAAQGGRGTEDGY